MMAEVIAIDFDGVLCDGLDECLLVAWLAFADRAQSGDLIFRIGLPENRGMAGSNPATCFSGRCSSIALLDTIPASFKSHFAHCRNFVRHSGHFIIPFLFPAPFETQAEFDAAYKTVEKGRLEAFLQRFEACRRRLRQERPEEWLALHTLYPGIRSALKAARLPLFIVTAKDKPSVLAILEGAGVNFGEDRIYGGITAKLGAFHDIMRQSGCGPERIAVYDDNVLNVAEARGGGFDAVWATWGYSSPEHQRIAASQSLPSITLDEFLIRLGSIPSPKT